MRTSAKSTTPPARLQAECERLQNRIHAMYIDKLDGRVDRPSRPDVGTVARRAGEIDAEITLHQAADQLPDEGVRLLELAQSTRAVRQTGAERATPHAEFCTIEPDLKNDELRDLPPAL
jgi:hypothetical protein